MVLFGGFHGFDDSGGESVVFQFIDPLDCDSARSGDLVDFYAGVGVIVLNHLIWGGHRYPRIYLYVLPNLPLS